MILIILHGSIISLHTQTLDFSAKSTMKSKVQNLLESGVS